jgi:hypothetical protein
MVMYSKKALFGSFFAGNSAQVKKVKKVKEKKALFGLFFRKRSSGEGKEVRNAGQ